MNTILGDEVKKYLVLEKSVLKANNYNVTYLKAELRYRNLDFKTNLTKAVYNEFHEGDLITKQDIRDRLNNVYQELNYNKRAKATDLQEWFSVRGKEINTNGQRKLYI